MKLNEIKEQIESISISALETSGRIEKKSMVGYLAIVNGNKIWRSNILTPAEARDMIEVYHSVKGPSKLRIIRITE
jgi:hypothetical protein